MMKNMMACSAMASVLVILSASSPAFALDKGVYVGVGGGAITVGNWAFAFPDNRQNLVRVRTGYQGILDAGFRYGPVRLEGEYNYQRNRVRTYVQNGVGQDGARGHLAVSAAMVNVYYDFYKASPNIVPYIGVGAGSARVNLDVGTNVGANQVRSDHRAAAYQGIIGAHISMNSHFAVNADYRYFRTKDVNITAVRTDSNLRVNGLNDYYESQSINVGLSYFF